MKVKIRVKGERAVWQEFADANMYAGDTYQISDDLDLFMEIKFYHSNNLERLLSAAYYGLFRRLQRWLTM